MSPLPTQMRDRWQNRAEPAPGRGTVYWHILCRDYPQVRATAREAQSRLSRFAGLHMTPEQWLHMTTLIAGSTDRISSEQMHAMLAEAQRSLSTIQPIRVILGRVLYHPEAIMLGIRPERALDPILKGIQEATREIMGGDGCDGPSSWTPHVTVSYSTADQAAEPIITALGMELPGCEVDISAVSLVIQWGPERLWDWEPIGTVRLGTVA
jgi:2'-5' RNA ligase